MTTWAVYDSGGKILYTVTGRIAPTAPDGGGVMVVPPGTVIGVQTHYVSGGELVDYVIDLTDAQFIASRSAQAFYNGLRAAGFTYNSVPYGVSEANMVLLNSFLAFAQATLIPATGLTWPADPEPSWYGTDGSVNGFAAATDFIAMANALIQYVYGLWLNYNAISSEIAVGATVIAVQNIAVTGGYPAAHN